MNKAKLRLLAALSLLAGVSCFGDDRPYDELVDCLETYGDQAYDSGVVGKSGMKFEIDMAYLRTDGDFQIIGTINGNNKMYVGEYRSAGRDQDYFCYGTTTRWPKVSGDTPLAPTVGQRYSYTVIMEKGYQAFWRDNVRYLQSDDASDVDTVESLYVFAYRSTSAQAAKGHAYARLYGLKIWQQDEQGAYQLVRDYKPAVKDGKGVLYDAKNNTVTGPVAGAKGAMPVVEPVAEEPDEIVDWIDTDGRQFVNTDFIGMGRVRFDVDFLWHKLTDPNGGNECSVLASTGKDQRYYLVHEVNKPDGCHFWVGYGPCGNYVTNSVGYGFDFKTLNRYRISGCFQESNQTWTVDGRDYWMIDSRMPRAQTATGTYPIYLFAANASGEASYQSSVRFYSLKLWRDDELVRDFSPCRKGRRYGLYDAVAKRIHYPSGGHAFAAAAGGVKARPACFIDYVETNGKTALDTGVIGRSGTRCEVDLQWRNLDGDFVVLGCNNADLVDSQRRFNMVNGYRNVKDAGDVPRCYFSYGTLWWPDPPLPLAADTRCRYVCELNCGSQTLTVNDATYEKSLTTEVDTQTTMALFAMNSRSGDTITPLYHSSVRLYSAKIWQDGKPVRDYRPVRLTSGEVALWDFCTDSYTSLVFSGWGGDGEKILRGGRIIVK